MPILRWLAIVALAPCAAAQQVAEPVRAEARDHNQKGIALARSGNHLAAVKEFRAAVALRPDYGEAHFNLGISLTQLGEVSAAVDAFHAAARLRPDSAVIHLALASVLFRRGETEDAIGEFRQSIRLDPSVADAHYNLGLALGQADGWKRPPASFARRCRSGRRWAPRARGWALRLRSLDRTGEAVTELREAIRVTPRDAEAHYNLGLALHEKGDREGALGEFEAAVAIRPDFEAARYNRALMLREIGQTQAAAAEMRQIGALSRFRTDLAQVKILLDSAASHLNHGDADSAIRVAEGALKLWQEDPVAHYLLGLGWEQKGNTAEARAHLEQAIKLGPDYAAAWNSLGLLRWREEDRAGARTALDRAVELSPERPEAHYNRGLVAAGEGDMARAERVSERAGAESGLH